MVLSLSRALRTEVDAILAAADLPQWLMFPLRAHGWRVGARDLRALVAALEVALPDEETTAPETTAPTGRRLSACGRVRGHHA